MLVSVEKRFSTDPTEIFGSISLAGLIKLNVLIAQTFFYILKNSAKRHLLKLQSVIWANLNYYIYKT